MMFHQYFFPVILIGYSSAYNSPSCPEWPDVDTWTDLSNGLSSSASLHGPMDVTVASYNEACLVGSSTNPLEIMEEGNGICQQTHSCLYEFCDPWNGYGFDLPAYIAEVKTVDDVIASLKFANEHDIQVSIKTTGHSFQGSNSAKDSLMIWMRHYEKDDEITKNYSDSCGNEVDVVIGINGGELWDEVIEAIGPDYHAVTGMCQSVSATGGWLQGSGLSLSSREYGIGIDQVVDYTVVLPSGEVVTADACTNPDLFWALRGGGGGTFGIVVNTHYKLHPRTDVVGLIWTITNLDYAKENHPDAYAKNIEQWVDFWVEVSPTLDTRWSGYFGPNGFYPFVFSGSLEDAKSTFLDKFDAWYENVLDKSEWISDVWGNPAKPGDSVTTHGSWKSFMDMFPYFDINTSEAIASQSHRLMPHDTVVQKPKEVKKLLADVILMDGLGPWNYFLGGKMNDVPEDATAVHPAMRNAIWHLHTSNQKSGQMVREFIPNTVTGVCFNHHNQWEPDWRNACWGDNHHRLSILKEKFDPDHRFNCWHCIGYIGEEVNLRSDGETLEKSGQKICPCSERKKTKKGKKATKTKEVSRRKL